LGRLSHEPAIGNWISEGHGETKPNNSRIMVFAKEGKFIKTFGPSARAMGRCTRRTRSPSTARITSTSPTAATTASSSSDGKFLAALEAIRPAERPRRRQERYVVCGRFPSSDNQGAANYNPGCRRGIRVGRVKDGKVMCYIPPSVLPDPKMQPPIGIVVDGNGATFVASDDQKDIKKYVKN
jgi:hypothetical protein